MSGRLNCYRWPGAWALGEAIKGSSELLPDWQTAVALWYSPAACQFARLDDEGALVDSQAQRIDCSTIFEARVFTGTGELRWLRGDGGVNRSVLLTELDRPAPAGCEVEPVDHDGVLDVRYLLWGEKAGDCRGGWCCLTTSRIGTLRVPLATIAGKEKRVQLTAREYLKEGEDGNVFVFEEILTGLEAGHERA